LIAGGFNPLPFQSLLVFDKGLATIGVEEIGSLLLRWWAEKVPSCECEGLLMLT
jgi:hypothetical protein